jgi:cytochrome c biogenesis protein CcdA
MLPLCGSISPQEVETGVQDLSVQVDSPVESPSDITFRELLWGLLLGLISGLSPTLLKTHADIISEVAQTTRQETDVIIRSLLFNGGIFLVLCPLFFILTSSDMFSLVTVLLGVVIGFNLLNSALRAFNSYTRIDIILKAKFVTYASGKSLQIGILHGLGKCADSAPLFLVVVYLTHPHGSFTNTILLLMLFLLGIVLTYLIFFLYALIGVNIFRKFTHNRIKQGFFMSCALLVLITAVMHMWDIRTTVNTSLAIVLTCILLVTSGAIIGFKKRIIY